MSNPIAEMRKRRDQKQIELTNLGYTFSPSISFDDLSVGEMTDLAELQIGQSTYVGEIGDVTRTA
jgi:hypothetical protein